MTACVSKYIWTYLYDFLLIGCIGLLQKVCKFSIETSRKLIHIFLSFTWLFLYYFFWPCWQIIIVPITFIIINWFSYKTKLFKMIERDTPEENHKGTIYFAIAITLLMVCALIFPKTIMSTGIATFCLCFGDGFAALFGSLFKKRIWIRKCKSVQGSLFCVLGASIGIIIFSIMTGFSIPWYLIALLSVTTALLELVGNGYDNFSIVAGIYCLSSLLL